MKWNKCFLTRKVKHLNTVGRYTREAATNAKFCMWDGHKYKWGEEWLDSTPGERVLRVTAGQQAQYESAVCALEAKRAKHTLECIKHSTTSWSIQVMIPLYSVLEQPHLECCVLFWAPQFKKDVKVLERPWMHPEEGWWKGCVTG